MGWSDLASTGRVALALFACAVAVPRPGHAQDNREPATLSARPDVTALQIAPTPPAPQAASMAADRKRELERWIRDYQKWQEWRHQWIRKGAISRDRKPRPQPPAWLPDECRDRTAASEAILVEACELLTDWNDDDDLTADLRYQIAVERAQKEKPTKTAWWEHVHFDGFWPVMNSESSVLGLVGAHVTVAIEGRFQIFVTPGVMLLSVPTGNGGRELKPATDWGFAYRLFDFHFPLTDRPASFHANFVRAWVMGNVGNLPIKSHVDLAGFSVTFKKTPK